MTTPHPNVREKRCWYELSLRHLRMARRLLACGFPDGAAFHAYHTYECALSAVIAASGWQVPPQGRMKMVTPRGLRVYHGPAGSFPDEGTHKARITLFNQIANHSAAYWNRHMTLSRFLTVNARNDALYYNQSTDQLPHQIYPRNSVEGLLVDIHAFLREVWQEIR